MPSDIIIREILLCRLALFQAVNTLSVFIGTNQGDTEVTKLSKVVVSGSTLHGMNVNDIKKAEDE